MSNESHDPTAPVSNLSAQIDALVARTAKPGATRIEGDQGAMRVTVSRDETGGLNSEHTVLRAPSPSSEALLPDNGIDTQAEAQRLHGRLTEMDEQLNAVAGYDRVTGKPIFALREGSRERQNAMLLRDQFAKSVAHQLQIFQQLDVQRETNKTATTGAEAERQLTEAFTRGDPVRLAALREELARMEAADAAALIYAARKGARR